jgi:hypothetical protein
VVGPVRPAIELVAAAERWAGGAGDEVLGDEDLQLTLTLLYELHYQGLEGADPEWEWSPDALAARALVEGPFEAAVRRLVAVEVARRRADLPRAPAADDVARVLFALTADDDGPAVSSFVQRHATVDQVRELLVHRSVYYLKEADPQSWAVPRLTGRAKAGLVEVLADEYGGGRPERMHSALFARTMRDLGLDDTYGAHLDLVPGPTLATVNAMSLFGLHRRLRGALAGHLAALEMTSSIPNRRYGNGLRRLGFGDGTTWYYDEHVEADAVHEQVAGRDLAGALVEQEPALLDDVLLGAAAALALDALAGRRLLNAWQEGRSSLRTSDRPLASARC